MSRREQIMPELSNDAGIIDLVGDNNLSGTDGDTSEKN